MHCLQDPAATLPSVNTIPSSFFKIPLNIEIHSTLSLLHDIRPINIIILAFTALIFVIIFTLGLLKDHMSHYTTLCVFTDKYRFQFK
jgi:hypothetical protein